MHICGKCEVMMRCEKNGVSVSPHPSQPEYTRCGDKFTCPSCGNSVITQFGDSYDSKRIADICLK